MKEQRVENGPRQTLMQAKQWLAAVLSVTCFGTAAQDVSSGYEHLLTTPESYVVPYTSQPPRIDGNLSDKAWQATSWTAPFTDIEGSRKPLPAYKTEVKMVWGDSCLYIAARLQDPHVWATLRQHDAIVYYDNDFEIFLDPDNDTHQYFEIEINPHNTVLDLFMSKPYRNGGQALISYDVPELRSAVKVAGTLNNPADRDSGWTVEAAIPFRAITVGNRWQAPQQGALWRVNFSRVQWQADVVKNGYQKKQDKQGRVLPEANWVWSPQGVINMHYPERWGYLQFTNDTLAPQVFVLPAAEKRKRYLWLCYYKQKNFFSTHGRYAARLQDLGIAESLIVVDRLANRLHMEATARQFCVSITDANNTLSVNDEGLIQTLKKTE